MFNKSAQLFIVSGRVSKVSARLALYTVRSGNFVFLSFRCGHFFAFFHVWDFRLGFISRVESKKR